MLLNLFLYLLILGNSIHDLPVATYNLQVSDFEIDIEIEFHQTDLQNALKSYNFIEHEVSNYITTNTKWIINDKVQVLQVCEFKTDDYHFIVKAQINTEEIIKKIELFNNCLINEIADHSNVVYVYQKNKKVRGFRSHKERQTLFIEL